MIDKNNKTSEKCNQNPLCNNKRPLRGFPFSEKFEIYKDIKNTPGLIFRILIWKDPVQQNKI